MYELCKKVKPTETLSSINNLMKAATAQRKAPNHPPT